jgi:excisionase family DNA binding protein
VSLECAEEREVLTAAEAAELLRVHREHLYVLCGQGKIPHARVGRSLRFSRHALLAWLAGRGAEGK